MTYTLYLAVVIPLFCCAIGLAIGAALSVLFESVENARIYGLLSLIFVLAGFVFVFISPDIPKLIENDYNKILFSRPECVKDVVNNDFTKISLECAEQYIDYRADSLERAERYFEIKEQILNKLNKTK